MLTFIRAGLGKPERCCEQTEDQGPHRPQKWRWPAGLRGRVPPSTQRPLAWQIQGKPVHGRRSPDQDWHREPMIQGILPLGWGVSVPLRKKCQPETSVRTFRFDVLSPGVAEDKVLPRMIVRKRPLPCLPTVLKAVSWHDLPVVPGKRSSVGGGSGAIPGKSGSKPLRNIPSPILGMFPPHFSFD